MSENESYVPRLALVVDAENISYNWLDIIIRHVEQFGVVTIKRAYADFTQPAMRNWKRAILNHAFTPVQQYPYATGKSCVDMAMIVDSMDLLYSGQIDGIVIGSGDSDFTRLAIRYREAGLPVYGYGKRNTPEAFRSACTRFEPADTLYNMENYYRNAYYDVQNTYKAPEAVRWIAQQPRQPMVPHVDQSYPSAQQSNPFGQYEEPFRYEDPSACEPMDIGEQVRAVRAEYEAVGSQVDTIEDPVGDMPVGEIVDDLEEIELPEGLRDEIVEDDSPVAKLVNAIDRCFAENIKGGEWVFQSTLKRFLSNELKPFSFASYGYNSFTQMMRDLGYESKPQGSSARVCYRKLKAA